MIKGRELFCKSSKKVEAFPNPLQNPTTPAAPVREQKVMASSNQRIPEEATIRKAVISLLKWKKKQISDQNPPLSGDTDDHIYLLLTLNKIPNQDFTKTPKKITFPHSLHPSPESCRSCLIIDDRPKPSSQKLTFDFADKKIKSLGIPISKILKLSKLKSDYRSFESKVDLFNSFDVFLADRRVIELLPEVLGKVFYKKRKKIPVPVDLRRDGDWKGEIEMGFCCSLLWLSKGTCSVVKVGKFERMKVEEIVENVAAAVGGVVEVVPKKWVGVKSFHLKFFDSLALPIYHKDDESVGAK
ncbi:putative ribosomal protein L1 [Helianthus annuus]|nr:putative ribosomal protein L1 [Helianthus annuus]